jgi:hypothetical protein
VDFERRDDKMKHLIVIIIVFQSFMLCACIRGRHLRLYNSTPEPLTVVIYKQQRNTLNPPGAWSPSRSQIIAPRKKQEIEAVIASTNTLYKIEASNSQGQVIYKDVFDYRTHKTFSIRPTLSINIYDMRLEADQ